MAKNASKAAEQEERKSNLTADQLKKVCADIINVAQRQTDSQTEVARLYKEAEGKFGINKAALKQVIALRKMSDEKRADFLRAFDDYREKLGLDQYDQGDILEGANDDAQAPEAAE